MSLYNHGRLGGSGGSDGGGVRISEDDAEKLQQKRKKNGLCPQCGEVQTHKKHLMRMVPQVRISYNSMPALYYIML